MLKRLESQMSTASAPPPALSPGGLVLQAPPVPLLLAAQAPETRDAHCEGEPHWSIGMRAQCSAPARLPFTAAAPSASPATGANANPNLNRWHSAASTTATATATATQHGLRQRSHSQYADADADASGAAALDSDVEEHVYSSVRRLVPTALDEPHSDRRALEACASMATSVPEAGRFELFAPMPDTLSEAASASASNRTALMTCSTPSASASAFDAEAFGYSTLRQPPPLPRRPPPESHRTSESRSSPSRSRNSLGSLALAAAAEPLAEPQRCPLKHQVPVALEEPSRTRAATSSSADERHANSIAAPECVPVPRGGSLASNSHAPNVAIAAADRTLTRLPPTPSMPAAQPQPHPQQLNASGRVLKAEAPAHVLLRQTHRDAHSALPERHTRSLAEQLTTDPNAPFEFPDTLLVCDAFALLAYEYNAFSRYSYKPIASLPPPSRHCLMPILTSDP